MDTRKNKEFISNIGDHLLSDALTWIATNLSPEEVFDEDQLQNWAYENGFTKDDEDEDDT